MPKPSKGKTQAPHERSIGAQMERRAFRAYLRRMIRDSETEAYRNAPVPDTHTDWLREILSWVLSRQKRFDKKPGGLGKR